MSPSKDYTATESVFLLASEDVEDFNARGPPTEQDGLLDSQDVSEDSDGEEDTPILKIPHIVPIEFSLLTNVFLASFDMTVAASTYTTIGSEFNAVNLSSWITTSYMITSTSFQPLYGAFSDVLGRRLCYFFATLTFSLGCLGCAFAPGIVTLFFARAFTGIGGGGLITLATVVNSDIIPAPKRGLFQGFQNILLGVGSILGASLGGIISETIGWRYCFLFQVPVSTLGLIFGYFYLKNQKELKEDSTIGDIDIQGSLLLVTGLTLQLLALYSSSTNALYLGAASLFLLLIFVRVELNTRRTPIVPFARIHNVSSYLTLLVATLSGFANFAYIFVLPLLFQVSLGDSPSKAGFRLAIPSLFTSVGALITAYIMNINVKYLNVLVLSGVSLMFVGNSLALLISRSFPQGLLNLLLIPANTGLGMCFPASLFTFVFSFSKSMQASSTSTLYLFRAVGQVWGVATVSKIVQSILERNLRNDPKVGNSIIPKILKSITYIKKLDPDIQSEVILSYEGAIRFAQKVSVLVCFLNVLFCLTEVVVNKRSQANRK